MTRASALAIAMLLLGLAAAQPSGAKPRATSPEAPSSPAGEALYDRGVLASGAPLVATRAGAEPLSGEQAACVNCHRRSGLGAQEARSVIPPITARFLFHPREGTAGERELPFVPGARRDRDPYTEATLARAIADGIDSEGHELSYLMPRYALGADDMAALLRHLRALDQRRVPGVSPTELHFATIITPDADPTKRRAVLDVLQRFFEDRNVAPRGQSALTMATSSNTAYAKSMFKVNRRWVLHVWEPTGPASTWTAQLERKFDAEPVFAVISGLGGLDWTPVHEFCEQRAVPCLFPNVEQPPAGADRDFHSLYFSRGVLLEADLIAAQLQGAADGGRPARVRQVYRAGDVGESAAQALAARLRELGLAASASAIARGAAAGAVAQSLHDLAPDEALVLWLRPADLAALPAAEPAAARVYLSGLLGGLDAVALPATWRSRAHMTYPFDLPERRRVRVDYALAWFRIRQIPVVAEQVQADTYLACGLLSETVKHLVDAFVPDYLVERFEDTVEHRIITGYYPRLSLAPKQRFASKGGFIVHFDESGSRRVLPDGEWLAP